MRSLVVLLLLALFFLTGMVVGMDRDGHQADTTNNKKDDFEQTESSDEQDPDKEKIKVTKVKEQNNDQVADAAAAEPAASNHFILKAASFLEAGVTGAYELVVRVAYQLAQVFF
ncbi:hypothetical protein [Lentibacillus juripiscarius]|uniref:Uncharacterized protein n=1 Tax=Lentibacillus juripiscarius TaxID=257446 RepID=A0ABW5V0G3_9BACI